MKVAYSFRHAGATRTILVVLFFACAALMLAWMVSEITKENPYYGRFVKTSLVFRENLADKRDNPLALNAYLRLSNVITSDVFMIVDPVDGIQAELLDADGKAVPEDVHFVSIRASPVLIHLPRATHRDWLIPNDLVQVNGESKDKYALIVGSHGWLIPVTNLGSYSLRIRFRGDPYARTVLGYDHRKTKLFLEVPATKIEVSK